jgi:hypothetical protein
MNLYHVILLIAPEIGESRSAGSGHFWANSVMEAQEAALDCWWDPRLDAASCKPVFRIFKVPDDVAAECAKRNLSPNQL